MVSTLRPVDRQRVAALLLVRYCRFQHDPKFFPWFEQQREALSRAVQRAEQFVLQDVTDPAVPATAVREVRDRLHEAIEVSDPDGPPFEAEIVDHLVFAAEVFDFIADPGKLGALRHAFERADELAEAMEEMGREDFPCGEWEPVEFGRLETAARQADVRAFADAHHDEVPPDVDEIVGRSRSLADAYAEVVLNCYTDQEAGRA
ncbi:hypothetical protein E1211_02950 [Micromonospora sp. 15K316]|uniref:hypothetical protein n=1 Tax=Micromonospora sp. 15K316 TaxID=2530376 RepID=UPI001052E2EE|nr:hypothetical protein [Micromonospora sp. 15K316]TDC39743.1 hypothetical protein E1211_02950 [Micromonospora sp. 15K316]